MKADRARRHRRLDAQHDSAARHRRETPTYTHPQKLKNVFIHIHKKAKPPRRFHANAHIRFDAFTEIRPSAKPPKRMNADTQNRIDGNTVLRKAADAP